LLLSHFQLFSSRALAAETLTLERTLSDLVNQAYSLTPKEIALLWQAGKYYVFTPSARSGSIGLR
jgi:hypothetical protein